MVNSGFEGTLKEVMTNFCKNQQTDMVNPVWISEAAADYDENIVIELPDYLGNTKIETTEGAAESIWNLTKQVRCGSSRGAGR